MSWSKRFFLSSLSGLLLPESLLLLSLWLTLSCPDQNAHRACAQPCTTRSIWILAGGPAPCRHSRRSFFPFSFYRPFYHPFIFIIRLPFRCAFSPFSLSSAKSVESAATQREKGRRGQKEKYAACRAELNLKLKTGVHENAGHRIVPAIASKESRAVRRFPMFIPCRLAGNLASNS